MFGKTLQQYRAINRNNKNSIRELLKQHKELLEDFQLLLTIPGIGEESAIAILAEIPDIKAFINARQLAAYAGTIPKI